MARQLAARKAVVMGLAKSGVAAAKFLAGAGARVTAADAKSRVELEEVAGPLEALGVKLVLGKHPPRLFAGADLIVVSPGVPRDHPLLVAAHKRGVEILGELEFAAQNLKAPLIAVTGTNGKSTVVSLIGEVMKVVYGAPNVFVGGNLGTPVTELLLEKRPVKVMVVEVSSFQLEYAPTLHPRVAVMLNITPDHLDRYRDYDDYIATKWSIFKNQTEKDFAVVNIDDPICAARTGSLRSRLLGVSLNQPSPAGMWIEDKVMVYVGPDGQRQTLPVSLVPLAGKYNLANVMAAICAARAMGAGMSTIAPVLKRFKALSHRLSLVRVLRDVRYFNDSKATNVGSVEAVALGLPAPLILLMGGLAKGCSFVELAEKIQPQVKHIMAFGESRLQIQKEMGKRIPVTVVLTMPEALASAAQMAAPGDGVLLAPGCASFDQFKDYKERGEIFVKLVKEMS